MINSGGIFDRGILVDFGGPWTGADPWTTELTHTRASTALPIATEEVHLPVFCTYLYARERSSREFFFPVLCVASAGVLLFQGNVSIEEQPREGEPSRSCCVTVLVAVVVVVIIVGCRTSSSGTGPDQQQLKKDVVIATDVAHQSVDNAIFPQNVLSVPSSAADLILLYSINSIQSPGSLLSSLNIRAVIS